MSRIGKKPIEIPSGTTVQISGKTVSVKGPKGQLEATIRDEISVKVEDNQVLVTRNSDNRLDRSLHGLSRTLIANMIEGVSKGFTKTLELVGVGYRCKMQGKTLVLQVGYSHDVEIEPPAGIEFMVEGVNKLHVNGIDKQLVGNTAAKIRAVRKPEPYKGKGIKYAAEKIRRKAGKSGKK